ncbi:MAG: lysylphosphatidylglycerol synthase domain-containing protein [Nocardioidaceae bacterium]
MKQDVRSDGQRRLLWCLKAAASVALVAVMFVFVLPLVVGATWSQLPRALSRVSLLDLVLLTGLWISGLVVHTVALTAAMPPLSHRRALTLSLTGSAVSNVSPLAGAVGIGLNYHMSRVWGFSRAEFVVFTFVTNLWDVMSKLLIPAVILATLVTRSRLTQGLMTYTAVVTMATLAALLLVVLTVVLSEPAARVVARGIDLVVSGVLYLIRRPAHVEVMSGFLDLRARSSNRIRISWSRLTAAHVAYAALLLALLWSCLRLTGSGLTPSQILAGFAVERLLTLAFLTPGGAGVVEVGLAGFLVAAGGDPVGTVAGVLLYRAFTFLLEIPVGGTLLAGWVWMRRRAPRLSPHPVEPQRALVTANGEAPR